MNKNRAARLVGEAQRLVGARSTPRRGRGLSIIASSSIVQANMSQRPEITITFAQSLDGCIATSTGDSRWISSDETLRLAHELRSEADAVLVGAGTVKADNPRLTCRISGHTSPLRVILDGRLSLPADSLVITSAHETPTYVITSDRALKKQENKVLQLRKHGVRLLTLPGGDGNGGDSDKLSNGGGSGSGANNGNNPDELSLHSVLELLSAEGIQRLLIEGGSGIITSFLRAGLFERLVLVTAPLIIGAGIPAVGDMGVRKLTSALKLRPATPRLLGPDLVWELYRE
ncbi:MAG: RibD family protein [Spirochaetaceae bacterium]|nr:MAG: RibD family protein [Spirochaetaceae bacterium]